MDLIYLRMDKKETEKNELLSEQETNDEEARVERRDGRGRTVPKLDLARLGSQLELELGSKRGLARQLGYTTAQDCAYCLARIIGYTTYVSSQHRQ